MIRLTHSFTALANVSQWSFTHSSVEEIESGSNRIAHLAEDTLGRLVRRGRSTDAPVSPFGKEAPRPLSKLLVRGDTEAVFSGRAVRGRWGVSGGVPVIDFQPSALQCEWGMGQLKSTLNNTTFCGCWGTRLKSR